MTQMTLPTDTQLAYAAGLIDGEGSIMIQRGVMPILVVTNCNQSCLEFLHALFGGGLHPDSYKGCFRLSLCGAEASNALKSILPYLIVKKELAETVLKWVYVGKGHKLTEEQKIDREWIVERVYFLNTKKTGAMQYDLSSLTHS